MGFQWDFNGISMGFQWDFNGVSIGFQWDLMWFNWGLIGVEMVRICSKPWIGKEICRTSEPSIELSCRFSLFKTKPLNYSVKMGSQKLWFFLVNMFGCWKCMRASYVQLCPESLVWKGWDSTVLAVAMLMYIRDEEIVKMSCLNKSAHDAAESNSSLYDVDFMIWCFRATYRTSQKITPEMMPTTPELPANEHGNPPRVMSINFVNHGVAYILIYLNFQVPSGKLT